MQVSYSLLGKTAFSPNTFSGKQKKRTGRANTHGVEGEQVPHISAFNFRQRSFLFTHGLSQTKNQYL